MNIHHCDRQRVQAYLDAPDNQPDDPEFIKHLDSCATCRRLLESEAVDGDEWSQFSSLLKPSEFDQASSAAFSAASESDLGVMQPAAIQQVLDGLTPSEDPGRLGRLGGYEVTGVIGAGGMGVVLKAIDTSLDRVVAMKVMAPHLAGNSLARKRFAREAKAAAAVLHPNVIPIHCVGNEQDDVTPYLVMAYVRGGSLQKRLEDQGALPTVQILRLGSQIAAGLSAAHDQGLVHRDIKPANILLEEGVERVTLTDFGLARAVDDVSLTQNGTIAGTPEYMSPEQARGDAVDQASDLFSLGSVLYALATGRPPFRADSSYGVMRRIIDDQPTPIREMNADVPAWLAVVIERLMSKSREQRYGSAAEVHALLDQCLSHVQQPSSSSLPESLDGVTDPVTRSSAGGWNRRHMGVAAAISLGIMAVVGVIAFPRPDAPPPEVAAPENPQPSEDVSASEATAAEKPALDWSQMPAWLRTAWRQRTIQQFSECMTALESFKSTTGAYPTADEGLSILVRPPADPALAERWRGPFAQSDRILLDPWGNAIGYERGTSETNGETTPRLLSSGPDGVRGTIDDIDLSQEDLFDETDRENAEYAVNRVLQTIDRLTTALDQVNDPATTEEALPKLKALADELSAELEMLAGERPAPAAPPEPSAAEWMRIERSICALERRRSRLVSVSETPESVQEQLAAVQQAVFGDPSAFPLQTVLERHAGAEVPQPVRRVVNGVVFEIVTDFRDVVVTPLESDRDDSDDWVLDWETDSTRVRFRDYRLLMSSTPSSVKQTFFDYGTIAADDVVRIHRKQELQVKVKTIAPSDPPQPKVNSQGNSHSVATAEVITITRTDGTITVTLRGDVDYKDAGISVVVRRGELILNGEPSSRFMGDVISITYPKSDPSKVQIKLHED